MAADALFVNGGVTDAREARLDSGALIAVQGATALDPRTGVMFGPGTTTLVTGTSATAPMAYAIAPHHAITSRGSSNGPYIGPTLDAATAATTTAAPASGSRIDVIYVKQQDATAGVPSPDGSTGPLYGVVQGTSSTGTPVKPALPVGAEELAWATVTSSATSTNGAGVTITNTARQSVARGAPVPVRTQAERDLLAAFNGLQVFRLDTGVYENYWNGAWAPSTRLSPWTTLGTPANYTFAQPATDTWADLTGMTGTVTVPAGYTLEVKFRAPLIDVAVSGSVFLRLMINGVQQDDDEFSAGPSATVAAPCRLESEYVGTGSAVAVAVQVSRSGNGGVVKGGFQNNAGGQFVGGVIDLRYRIR